MNQQESMGIATGTMSGMGGMNTLIDHPDTPMIKNLVQQREQARARKDFARSDELRNQLKAMGVEVYDKEKMWKSNSGASGVVLGYRGTGGPTDLEITTLVVQRERARQNKDFTLSDVIRSELKAVGVEIYDKEKLWKASDGRQGPVPSYDQLQATGGAPIMAAATNTQAGGASNGVSPSLQTEIISTALAAAQNPANAAQVLAILQQFAGSTGNSNGGAAAGSTAPTAQPDPSKVSDPEALHALSFISDAQAAGRPAQDSEIEWLVTIREKCRQNKDYASADEIRNAMKNGINVELWEKDKRWTCADGRSGTIPLWTAMS